MKCHDLFYQIILLLWDEERHSHDIYKLIVINTILCNMYDHIVISNKMYNFILVRHTESVREQIEIW